MTDVQPHPPLRIVPEEAAGVPLVPAPAAAVPAAPAGELRHSHRR